MKALGYAAKHTFSSLKTVGGSLIGGIHETQEVLNFGAGHNITPAVELIPIQEINEAYTKVNEGEVRFRYVINMASLKQEVQA